MYMTHGNPSLQKLDGNNVPLGLAVRATDPVPVTAPVIDEPMEEEY